jgi:hypothetical protein
LKEDEEITAGFVSPLKGMPTSMIELHNKSIMKLRYQGQLCIRTISLEMNQLTVEARERDVKDCRPIMIAAHCYYPLRVLKRLQFAYQAGANAQDVKGSTPLMLAVWQRKVEYVDLLLRWEAALHFLPLVTRMLLNTLLREWPIQEVRMK